MIFQMICRYLFLFYRAYRERPDYKKTILGINKSKCAIENSLSRTNKFNFLQMKDIIEEIIAEEEYKSKEAERYQSSQIFLNSSNYSFLTFDGLI